jgi:hypothetical protein
MLPSLVLIKAGSCTDVCANAVSRRSRLQLCDGRSEELVDARLADPRILPGQGHSGGRSCLNSLRFKQNRSVGALALASGEPATVMPISRRVRGRPSLTRRDLTMN